MKKTICSFIAMFAIMFAFIGCGSSNTPTGVAENALKCIQKSDFKSFIDLINIEGSNKEDIDQKKVQLEALLSGKMSKALEAKSGLKSWEILSEEISEDGNKAKVKVKQTWGDGTEEDDEIDFVKDADGNWKLSMNK